MIGKCTEPSVRVAVPTTPGVRPSEVSASVNPLSSATAVLPPKSSGTAATGAGIFAADAASDDALAAEMPTPATSRPAAASPITVREILFMVCSSFVRDGLSIDSVQEVRHPSGKGLEGMPFTA